MKNFDLDWWGISHKTSLDFILKNDDSDKINVYASGFTSLRDTYLFLNEEDKSRIILSNIDEANYIIDNKMKRIRPYRSINKNEYSKYYILKVDDIFKKFIKKFKNFNGIINFINIILIYERIHDKKL